MTPDSGEPVISCANDQAVWPWQAEPYRLWSLLDMLQHLGGNWVAITNNLERIRWLVSLAPNDQTAWNQLHSCRDSVASALLAEVDVLPFSSSLRKQTRRFVAELETTTAVRFSQADAVGLITRLEELHLNIQAEFEDQLFFVIPRDRKPFFSFGDTDLFGTSVATAFPDATPEINEAGRCFALDRWTASVFHLMRALELALHRWAHQLGVDQFSAIELENWKNILDAAEKKIKALEQLPKGLQKDADLQYYGEALGRYRSIKDAWRNHVAHAKERYDERRALSIFENVREFMGLLASRS